MSFAIATIVKATIVCGAAFFLSYLCRRTRASIRHFLFALGFAALLGVPAASLVVPTLAVTLPAAVVPAQRAQDNGLTVPVRTDTDVTASNTPALSRDTATGPSVNLVQVVAAIWVSGFVLFLIPVIVGCWQLRRLRESALPWAAGHALSQKLASSLDVHRLIDTRLHDGITGPLTCGVLKPSIILPAGAERWDEAYLRCSLRHELEHVARWDFLTHCLSRIVCAAYWFHPLVWAAWRRLRLEAERACDDAVLQERDARDYASLLVSIAQGERAVGRQPLLAMAGRDDLAARIAAVLNDHQPRGRVGGRLVVGLIAIGTVVMLGMASMTVMRAMPQTQATANAAPRPRFETVHLERSQGFGTPLIKVSDRDGLAGVGPDGRVRWLTAINQPALSLLWWAYGNELRGNGRIAGFHQIVNAPGWVDSDLFDLLAKTPSRATPEDIREMMQSLLAERFKLVAHRESREFPISALVMSQPDRRLGPRMTPSQTDCSYKPGASSPCGLSGTGAGGRLAGRGVTIAQLIKVLPYHVGSDIGLGRLIDRTGLSGAFDFTLEWTPDPVAPETRAPSQAAPQLSGTRTFNVSLESRAPNFVAALLEQLGLRLNRELVPEPVLVIDAIERPF